MSSKGSEFVADASSDLENRVEARFGVLPNFFALRTKPPRLLRNSGDSHKPPTSTTLCPPFLRSGFSFICRAFAQSVIALLVMLVFWWDLAVPLAIRLCVRRVLQTLLSSFDGLFHADRNFSLAYHCAQPAPRQLF